MNKGLLYIIYGKDYAEKCLESIKSIRNLEHIFSKIPIIITQIDHCCLNDEFNNYYCPVIHIKSNINYNDKVRTILIIRAMSMINNPFDRFILMHADTIFKGECSLLIEKCNNIMATVRDLNINHNLSFEIESKLNLKLNFKMIDSSIISMTSEVGKIIGKGLLDCYKKINNDIYYQNFDIESILMTCLLSDMGIKVTYVSDIYNSKVILPDSKIFHQ